jgi:hypothetical protein
MNLRHPEFRDRYLGSTLTSFAWRVLENGSNVEKFVLEWCLDNVVPYRAWIDKPEQWSFVTYEELMLKPRSSLVRLGHELSFPVTGRMNKLAGIPSSSTTIQRRESLAASHAPDWLVRWRQDVDESLDDRAFEIVAQFGIRLYEPGRTVASDAFLHFAETPRV